MKIDEKQVIFLNIGWMVWYNGLKNDPIRHGGLHVEENLFGWEIFNFQRNNGYCYGYAPTPCRRIRIERIGPPIDDIFVSDTLVVWVAKSKDLGSVVVGWYDNAKVFRELQSPPSNSFRKDPNKKIAEYLVSAKARDCVLLESDSRVLTVPRGKGAMGKAAIWYGEQAPKKFAEQLERLIKYGELPKKKQKNAKKSRQNNVAKRLMIERNSMEIAVAYYIDRGYDVNDVSIDTKGWDIEAALGRKRLLVEVKGLSGNDVSAELTPNEYSNMMNNLNDYRVFVVTNALSKRAKNSIFFHNTKTGKWEDTNDKETILKIQTKTGAMIYI